jgi:hypothetical protein
MISKFRIHQKDHFTATLQFGGKKRPGPVKIEHDPRKDPPKTSIVVPCDGRETLVLTGVEICTVFGESKTITFQGKQEFSPQRSIRIDADKNGLRISGMESPQ